MTHYSTFVVSILLLVVFAAGCARPNSNEFKLGVVLPLTGDYAEYGSRVKRGVDLAVEEINAAGGVTGRVLQAMVQDTQSQARNAVSALNKLADTDGVKYFIGEVSSTNTLAMIPAIDQRRLFLFAPVSSSPKLTNASPLFARNWPADDAEAARVAEYALSMGETKAAVLYVNLDYGIGLGGNFRSTFERGGGSVVLYEGYDGSLTDFRTIAAKVNASGADVVFLGGYHKDMAYATKALREIVSRPLLILAGTDYEVAEVLQIAGSGAEGVVYGTPMFDPDSKESGVQSFVQKYRQRYQSAPSLFEANAYDAVRLICDLVQKVGDDPVAVAATMRGLKDFHGASGIYSFQADGDVSRDITLRTVRGAQFVSLSQPEGH